MRCRMTAFVLGCCLFGISAAQDAGGAKIVFENTTANCGIAMERAPMKPVGRDEEVLRDQLKKGVGYFDWPFDVSCGDLDGDGHVDIVLTDHHPYADNQTVGGIWLGNGDGTFGPNMLERTTIVDDKQKPAGLGGAYAVFIDVNGDGKMDLCTTEGGGCIVNEGVEGSGPTRTVKLKLTHCGGARGWTFNDFNRDGNLDVAYGWGSAVLFGSGKGSILTQWKESAQAAGAIKPFEDPFHHCISADFRRTGAADIFGGQAVWRWAWGGKAKQDRKEPRGIFMLNDGKGAFTEAAEAMGVAESSSCGPIAAADFTNKGFFDLVSVGLGNESNPPRLRIYVNENGKKFTLHAGDECGVPMNPKGNGIPLQYCNASAIDLDNDGLPDLVIADGQSSSVRIFHNLGNYKFEEVAAVKGGTDHLRFAAADLNEDGMMDLVLLGGAPMVYLNRTRNNNGWLDVSVKGLEGNVCGVGALVEVFKPGKLGDPQSYAGMQHVVAESQNHVPLAPHFGLGALESVDVRVTLPTGQKLELANVKRNTRLNADFQSAKIAASR